MAACSHNMCLPSIWFLLSFSLTATFAMRSLAPLWSHYFGPPRFHCAWYVRTYFPSRFSRPFIHSFVWNCSSSQHSYHVFFGVPLHLFFDFRLCWVLCIYGIGFIALFRRSNDCPSIFMTLAFQCVLSLQKVHYALPRLVIRLYFSETILYCCDDGMTTTTN